MDRKKRILVSPLDWGLGHATRCIPIIHELLSQNVEVIIASDERPLKILKTEFPFLTFIKLKGYDISYQEKGSFFWKIFKLTPGILRKILNEHEALKVIVEKYEIDGIISDNRFGLFHKTVPTIFITHQVWIDAGIFSGIIQLMNKWFLNKHIDVWIPDFEGDYNLSGKLSHKKNHGLKLSYLGPISRFKKSATNLNKQYDLIAILSGPEPQRTIFENMILSQLSFSNLKAVLVRGTPGKNLPSNHLNVEIFDHLSAKDLQEKIELSAFVLSRSGYTTIMDLSILNKKAFFVPTPGQTEQEYLAENLAEQKKAVIQNQKSFDLLAGITEIENISALNLNSEENKIQEKVTWFLNQI